MRKHLILVLCLLAGCTMRYDKPGATPEALEQDRAACSFYLKTHGDGVAWPYLMNECLQTKGWQRVG
jgi:hypothetical protein